MSTEASAYIPSFDCDILISDSHVDNLTNWVSTFKKEFENRLAQRVGRLGRVRFWGAGAGIAVQSNGSRIRRLLSGKRRHNDGRWEDSRDDVEGASQIARHGTRSQLAILMIARASAGAM